MRPIFLPKYFSFFCIFLALFLSTINAGDLPQRLRLAKLTKYLSPNKQKNKKKNKKEKKLLFEETLKGKKRKPIHSKLGDAPSSEDDGLTAGLALSESDVNPDLLDSSKKIVDFLGFMKNLREFEKNNLKIFYEEFSVLINQIARLPLEKQLDTYFELLYNNLDSSATVISLLWDSIIHIYHSYIQPDDPQREKFKKFYDIFITWIIPNVEPDVQKQLEEIMAPYKPYERFVALAPLLSQHHDVDYYSSEQSIGDLAEADFSSWHNALCLVLPPNTVCYTVPEHSIQLIVATHNQGIYHYDPQKKKLKLLKPQEAGDNKVGYHMITYNKKIHYLKTKPKHIPSAALVAFDRYFLGYPSGIIRVNNVKAETKRALHGHKKNEAITGLVLLDNNLIASSSTDGTIKIWNHQAETCIQTLGSNVGRLDGLVKAGNFLISYANQRHLELWENPGIEGKTKKLKNIEVTYAPILSIGSYQNCFFTGLKNGSLLVWDPKQRKCIHEFSFENELPITKLTLNNTALMVLQQSMNKQEDGTPNKKILTLFMFDEVDKASENRKNSTKRVSFNFENTEENI